MKRVIIVLTLIIFSNLASAQSNYEKFTKLFIDKDTTKIKSLLAAWEKSDPNDPEFYTSAFNFYFSNSKRDIISIDERQRTKETFQLTDSTGKVVGYFNSNVSYDPEKLGKALGYLNKGIDKFPDRLDIRFGKSYVLGAIFDYENFTTEIIKTIEYSNTISNNWLWTKNEKLEDAQNFMLGTIQSYLRQLYDTEDDNLLKNMKQIGEVALKYYPDRIEILSTTAIAYLLTKDYDKAIGYLKHAERLNPQDFIVLGNIAQGYKLKGDKANAIKYYELYEKYGDAQAKEQARDNIETLKKQ
jgi:tetratricopeptide (TPR) repeat protein